MSDSLLVLKISNSSTITSQASWSQRKMEDYQVRRLRKFRRLIGTTSRIKRFLTLSLSMRRLVQVGNSWRLSGVVRELWDYCLWSCWSFLSILLLSYTLLRAHRRHSRNRGTGVWFTWANLDDSSPALEPVGNLHREEVETYEKFYENHLTILLPPPWHPYPPLHPRLYPPSFASPLSPPHSPLSSSHSSSHHS